jgi:hypothetical protein
VFRGRTSIENAAALCIARTGELPPGNYSSEATQPPLYYWLASRPLVLLDQIDPSLADFYSPELLPYGSVPRLAWDPGNYRFLWGPQLLRWIGLLPGGLTLHLVFRGVRRFAPRSPALRLAAVSLVGLTPQFLHVSASVSNDALANLAGACLFWLLSGVSSKPLRWRDVAFLASAALFLPMVTKLTVLPVGAALCGAVIWETRDRWRAHSPRMLTGAGNGVTVGSTRARTGKPGTQTRPRPHGPPRQPSTLPAVALLFALWAEGCIAMRRIDGYRDLAAVLVDRNAQPERAAA